MNPPLSASEIPAGFTFSAVHCGLKRAQLDLGILLSETPASAAAVFTTNQVVAAPVIVVARAPAQIARQDARRDRQFGQRELLHETRWLSRVCRHGAEACRRTRRHRSVADSGLLHRRDRRAAARGENSRRGPAPRAARAAPKPAAFEEFARAIMTTDTRPKWAAAKCRIGGKQVRLLGCAKGSGMIHPNMATMLAFIATDAAISPALLDRALRLRSRARSIRITVDGDTSTNDTVAHSRQRPVRRAPQSAGIRRRLQSISRGARKVCKSLALAIVEDGEGAQRVIEIEVRGAPSERAADRSRARLRIRRW